MSTPTATLPPMTIAQAMPILRASVPATTSILFSVEIWDHNHIDGPASAPEYKVWDSGNNRHFKGGSVRDAVEQCIAANIVTGPDADADAALAGLEA